MPRKKPGEYTIPKDHVGAIRYAQSQVEQRNQAVLDSAVYQSFQQSQADLNTYLNDVAVEMKCARPGVGFVQKGERYLFVEGAGEMPQVGEPVEEDEDEEEEEVDEAAEEAIVGDQATGIE